VSKSVYSRPAKGSHLATIQYEIDMLNYCYQTLASRDRQWDPAWGNPKNAYICLESFLLHYRNLVEFFGSAEDLKVTEPKLWVPEGRHLTIDEIDSISDRKLCEKYRGEISAYLQHCTKKRANVDRSWDVGEMNKEIQPLIARFHDLFPW